MSNCVFAIASPASFWILLAVSILALAANVVLLPETSYNRSESAVIIPAPADYSTESKETGSLKDPALVIVQPCLDSAIQRDIGSSGQSIITRSNLKPWKSTSLNRQELMTAIYRPAL